MKAHFYNEEYTELSIRPETSTDEQIISRLLAIFIRGGVIVTLEPNGRETICHVAGLCEFEDATAKQKMTEYIEDFE